MIYAGYPVYVVFDDLVYWLFMAIVARDTLVILWMNITILRPSGILKLI